MTYQAMTRAMMLLLCGMMLTSCATLISGSTARITVDGEVDEPVTIVTSKDEYRDVKLPTTVEVKRRHLDGQLVRVTSQNHAFHDIVLQKKFNEWSLLSAYFMVVPISVDLLTNAVSKPRQQNFFIRPAGPSALADSLHQADSLHVVAMAEMRRQAKMPPAKYRRHEFTIGIGVGRSQTDRDNHDMIRDYEQRYSMTTEGGCGYDFGDSYMSVGLEYHYRLNRKWDIGLLASWGISRENYEDWSHYYPLESSYAPATPDQRYYATGSEQSRFFAIAPSIRFTWYEQYFGRVYSRVALGMLRHHLSYHYDRYGERHDYGISTDPFFSDATSDIRWRMAYQLTAIGGNLGPDKFHCFGELGYGCLGVVRFGLRFSF